MRPPVILAALAAAGAVAATAFAQNAPMTNAPMMATGAAERGYLAAAPDALMVLPPAPRPGSPRDVDDKAVFKATRALAGRPRWSLAISDANLAQGALLFSCALGVKLDASSAPALADLLHKAAADADAATEAPKRRYARPRPFTAPGAGAAPICTAKTEALARSASYPSGHATIAWTWGLILAELAPDRAGAILARARSIGDSRVVCGVHYRSDIEAGRMTGSVTVAALHGDAAFRADLERARAELAALRAGPHAEPTDCAVQDAAASHPPY